MRSPLSLIRNRKAFPTKYPKQKKDTDPPPVLIGKVDKLFGFAKLSKLRKWKLSPNKDEHNLVPPYDLRKSLRRTRPQAPLPLDLKLSQSLYSTLTLCKVQEDVEMHVDVAHDMDQDFMDVVDEDYKMASPLLCCQEYLGDVMDINGSDYSYNDVAMLSPYSSPVLNSSCYPGGDSLFLPPGLTSWGGSTWAFPPSQPELMDAMSCTPIPTFVPKVRTPSLDSDMSDGGSTSESDTASVLATPLDSPPLESSANLFTPEPEDDTALWEGAAPLDETDDLQHILNSLTIANSARTKKEEDEEGHSIPSSIGLAPRCRTSHRISPYNIERRRHPRRLQEGSDYLCGERRFCRAELAGWLNVGASPAPAVNLAPAFFTASDQFTDFLEGEEGLASDVAAIFPAPATEPAEAFNFDNSDQEFQFPHFLNVVVQQLDVEHEVPVVLRPASDNEVLNFLGTVKDEVNFRTLDSLFGSFGL